MAKNKEVKPIYDPLVSYEMNYEQGPFGPFAEEKPPTREISPKDDFLGFKLNSVFGIPAGPLLNSNFIKAAFNWSFDICTYKTVRGESFPCHPLPNILKVNIDGQLTRERFNIPLIAQQAVNLNITQDGITNSFGVPSKPPEVWREDVKRALQCEGEGQLLILSFMGTKHKEQTRGEYIADFARTAKLAQETGVKVLEVNLSCPNIGKEGLICYDIETSSDIVTTCREVLGNTPLLIKIGYFLPEEQDLLARLIDAISPKIAGIAAVNTIQAEIVDEQGNQALPGGAEREKSGICGSVIRWAGLEMTERLANIRKQKGDDFAIIGVGGVTKPEDYFLYREAGADAVQSATGAMWNPYLAYEIYQETRESH